jgi:hypothetical protein
MLTWLRTKNQATIARCAFRNEPRDKFFEVKSGIQILFFKKPDRCDPQPHRETVHITLLILPLL